MNGMRVAVSVSKYGKEVIPARILIYRGIPSKEANVKI